MKTYYAHKLSGDVRCFDCAGHQLKESITNARKDQRTFKSFDGSFVIATGELVESLKEIVGDSEICNCI